MCIYFLTVLFSTLLIYQLFLKEALSPVRVFTFFSSSITYTTCYWLKMPLFNHKVTPKWENQQNTTCQVSLLWSSIITSIRGEPFLLALCGLSDVCNPRWSARQKEKTKQTACQLLQSFFINSWAFAVQCQWKLSANRIASYVLT